MVKPKIRAGGPRNDALCNLEDWNAATPSVLAQWETLRVFAMRDPGEPQGLHTPDGVFSVTFTPALAECNCATAVNPPYDCPVHGVRCDA